MGRTTGIKKTNHPKVHQQEASLVNGRVVLAFPKSQIPTAENPNSLSINCVSVSQSVSQSFDNYFLIAVPSCPFPRQDVRIRQRPKKIPQDNKAKKKL